MNMKKETGENRQGAGGQIEDVEEEATGTDGSEALADAENKVAPAASPAAIP